MELNNFYNQTNTAKKYIRNVNTEDVDTSSIRNSIDKTIKNSELSKLSSSNRFDRFGDQFGDWIDNVKKVLFSQQFLSGITYLLGIFATSGLSLLLFSYIFPEPQILFPPYSPPSPLSPSPYPDPPPLPNIPPVPLSPPPVPSSPPVPPFPPPFECKNDCVLVFTNTFGETVSISLSNNSICEDAVSDTLLFPLCDFGSDCEDCGVRFEQPFPPSQPSPLPNLPPKPSYPPRDPEHPPFSPPIPNFPPIPYHPPLSPESNTTVVTILEVGYDGNCEKLKDDTPELVFLPGACAVFESSTRRKMSIMSLKLVLDLIKLKIGKSVDAYFLSSLPGINVLEIKTEVQNSFPPFPPFPPFPLTKNTICFNDCKTPLLDPSLLTNNVCDDGGMYSVSDECDYGHDCLDCGLRIDPDPWWGISEGCQSASIKPDPFIGYGMNCVVITKIDEFCRIKALKPMTVKVSDNRVFSLNIDENLKLDIDTQSVILFDQYFYTDQGVTLCAEYLSPPQGPIPFSPPPSPLFPPPSIPSPPRMPQKNEFMTVLSGDCYVDTFKALENQRQTSCLNMLEYSMLTFDYVQVIPFNYGLVVLEDFKREDIIVNYIADNGAITKEYLENDTSVKEQVRLEKVTDDGRFILVTKKIPNLREYEVHVFRKDLNYSTNIVTTTREVVPEYDFLSIRRLESTITQNGEFVIVTVTRIISLYYSYYDYGKSDAETTVHMVIYKYNTSIQEYEEYSRQILDFEHVDYRTKPFVKNEYLFYLTDGVEDVALAYFDLKENMLLGSVDLPPLHNSFDLFYPILNNTKIIFHKVNTLYMYNFNKTTPPGTRPTREEIFENVDCVSPNSYGDKLVTFFVKKKTILELNHYEYDNNGKFLLVDSYDVYTKHLSTSRNNANSDRVNPTFDYWVTFHPFDTCKYYYDTDSFFFDRIYYKKKERVTTECSIRAETDFWINYVSKEITSVDENEKVFQLQTLEFSNNGFVCTSLERNAYPPPPPLSVLNPNCTKIFCNYNGILKSCSELVGNECTFCESVCQTCCTSPPSLPHVPPPSEFSRGVYHLGNNLACTGNPVQSLLKDTLLECLNTISVGKYLLYNKGLCDIYDSCDTSVTYFSEGSQLFYYYGIGMEQPINYIKVCLEYLFLYDGNYDFNYCLNNVF